MSDHLLDDDGPAQARQDDPGLTRIHESAPRATDWQAGDASPVARGSGYAHFSGGDDQPDRVRYRPTLLVVDDCSMNRAVMQAMLAGRGYPVDLAANGAAAAEAVLAYSYAAVFMDLTMPVLDGLSAARAIRRQEDPRRRTPLIALTAADPAEWRPLCFEHGMDDFLSKPARLEDIERVLARCIDLVRFRAARSL